jgi:hypothetical protein
MSSCPNFRNSSLILRSVDQSQSETGSIRVRVPPIILRPSTQVCASTSPLSSQRRSNKYFSIMLILFASSSSRLILNSPPLSRWQLQLVRRQAARLRLVLQREEGIGPDDSSSVSSAMAIALALHGLRDQLAVWFTLTPGAPSTRGYGCCFRSKRAESMKFNTSAVVQESP